MKNGSIEFETIKSHKNRLYFLCGIVCVVVLLVVFVVTRSHAKYRTTESIPLINGTINYTPYDLKMVAMYQEENGDYKSIDTVPTSGYTLNEEKSYCEVNDNKDNNITIEYQNGSINFLGMTKKGTKCYLYFDKQTAKKVDTILGQIDVNLDIPDFSKTAQESCSDTSICEETNGIYESIDDYGTTYYYRGAVNNNWLKFAGFYWRIIRINGDGSIRLIYNGTSTEATGEEAQIETSKFNNLYNNNAYVGYMYTSGQVHGLGTNSGIKDILDSWYQTNITNKGYGNKVSTEVGFCGDREPSTSASSSNGSGGTGTTTTYYGASIRLDINKTPTLKCKNSSDLYTINGSSKGNKALTNPVGLITADEVAMAGGVYGQINQNYYLYTNQIYWTMSPYYFSIGSSSSWASVSVVNSIGNLGYNCVDNSRGVRPVINIASDVEITGSGTSSDPYVVI